MTLREKILGFWGLKNSKCIKNIQIMSKAQLDTLKEDVQKENDYYKNLFFYSYYNESKTIYDYFKF